MRIRGIEIDQRRLYFTAIIAMGIVTVGNIATLLQTYKILLFSQIASSVGGILLNLAFWGFFFYLFKQLPPKIDKVATDEDMREILKQAVEDKNERKWDVKEMG